MPEINEWEARQIQGSISKIDKGIAQIAAKLSRDPYSETIYKAQEKLKAYARIENDAIRNAEKAIKNAMQGAGFLFSREGFNTIMRKKQEESSRKISAILDDYYNSAKNIISALPKLGDSSIDYSIFDTSEYDGDKSYDVFSNFSTGDIELDDIAISFGSETDFADTTSAGAKKFAECEPPKKIIAEAINFGAPIEAEEYITPDDLIVIKIDMFSHSKIRKLICKNVNEIQANAFKGIDGLELIVFGNSIRTININAFRGLENKCIIAFEGNKDFVLKTIASPEGLINRKVIFGYVPCDETLDKTTVFTIEAKPEKSKRVIIKADTPLDNDTIKQAFIKRNDKYKISITELNAGIVAAKSNTNKDLVMLETLKVVLKRNLSEINYWDYAATLQGIIKFAKVLSKTDDALNAIFGLFYLDSSGYRMVIERSNPYKQDPSMMYYHPKMQMNDLYELQKVLSLTDNELAEKYRNSPYVVELSKRLTDAYYTVENSIKMMLMAMRNPDYIFYPAQSGISRR